MLPDTPSFRVERHDTNLELRQEMANAKKCGVIRASSLLLSAFLILGCSLASPIPESSELKAGRSTIQIKFSEVVPQEYRRLIQNWVSDGAEAVTSVYDRFPVARLTVAVRVTRGRDVADGVTFDGRLIRISVGEGVTRDTLRSDWKMTHEMFHLGFPTTDEGRDWMGEGVSTYAEPFARARAGQLSEEEVWRGFIEGLPNGLPRRHDRGLDRTPTWGRTYWGGALFWLMADLEIRKRSGNGKSLDNVLRAIAREGGDGSTYWPAAKIFQRGDAAIGMPVLEELHARMGSQPVTPDLSSMWRQLGVSIQGKKVVFTQDAPLAAIRRSMTERRKHS